MEEYFVFLRDIVFWQMYYLIYELKNESLLLKKKIVEILLFLIIYAMFLFTGNICFFFFIFLVFGTEKYIN